jgi:hypothetical protein
MNGNIDERNPSCLLEEITGKLNIELDSDESLRLIYDVLKPFLQKQFDEGVKYAKSEVLYLMKNIDKQ